MCDNTVIVCFAYKLRLNSRLNLYGYGQPSIRALENIDAI